MVKHCKIKSVYCLFVLDLALNNECDEKDRAKYLAEMQVRRKKDVLEHLLAVEGGEGRVGNS